MHMVIAPPPSGMARQRATRSGTWSVTGWAIVPGWVSDPAHPAVIDADQLVVTGTGAVSIAVVTDGAWTSFRQLSLRVDGIEVAASTGTGTVDWTGMLSDGQRVTLWCGRGSSGGSITAASLDIVPA